MDRRQVVPVVDMDRRQVVSVVGTGVVAAVAGCLSGDRGAESDTEETAEWPPDAYRDYETTVVSVETAYGEQRGSINTVIADTSDRRFLGLSAAESMPADAGMLFVFDSEASRTFVMREMDFGIDIVYADSDRQITSIHHAPAPEPGEDGNSQRYPGEGQYVLEVTYEWTKEYGVGVGDRLAFEL